MQHTSNELFPQKPIITFLNHSMMVMTLIDGAYWLWFGVQLGLGQGHLSYEDIMKCYALPNFKYAHGQTFMEGWFKVS